MNTSAEIRLWGTVVGAVTLSDGQRFASFEYNPSFVQTGIQIAPITMPFIKLDIKFIINILPFNRYSHNLKMIST